MKSKSNETKEKRGLYMWPSQETASLLYNIANLGLILGLVIGVISTILVVWMGNVKEGYLDKELAGSQERTALLEKQSGEAQIAIAKANADAAQSLATAKQAEANLAAANERAAQAEQKAAEAKLALEKFKAPRSLSPEDRQLLVSNLSKFAGQEYTAVLSSTGFDVRPLWVALDKTLTEAGWSRVNPAGLASGDPPAGIAIESSPGVMITIDRNAYPKLSPAVEALSAVLNQLQIDTKIAFGRDHKEKRLNVITIRIGQKPQ